MSSAIVVLSGGLDSTTAAYWAQEQFGSVELLSFDYSQRHKVELTYAAMTADELDAPHYVVDLSSVNQLIPSSVLTNPETRVPEGHYASETMAQTVVPNRNSMMLNIAIARAVSAGSECVVTGVHSGDHVIYPDCRAEFIDTLNELALTACEGFIKPHFTVLAPFIEKTKSEIVIEGERLGVPWDNTWSCYKGGYIHCGRCSTCLERIEAFTTANVVDPTAYQDLSLYCEMVARGELG